MISIISFFIRAVIQKYQGTPNINSLKKFNNYHTNFDIFKKKKNPTMDNQCDMFVRKIGNNMKIWSHKFNVKISSVAKSMYKSTMDNYVFVIILTW